MEKQIKRRGNRDAELSGTGILTEGQAAEILDVAPGTLQAWRYEKRYDLPYLKIGSLVRYRSQDISAFLERRLVK
jgi:Helix-turn-helix domain